MKKRGKLTFAGIVGLVTAVYLVAKLIVASREEARDMADLLQLYPIR